MLTAERARARLVGWGIGGASAAGENIGHGTVITDECIYMILEEKITQGDCLRL